MSLFSLSLVWMVLLVCGLASLSVNSMLLPSFVKSSMGMVRLWEHILKRKRRASLWENRPSGFPPWSDTNRSVHQQKMIRGLDFLKRECTIQVAKSKALISFAVTAMLICVFVFTYAKIRFSHVAAQIMSKFVNYLFENRWWGSQWCASEQVKVWLRISNQWNERAQSVISKILVKVKT